MADAATVIASPGIVASSGATHIAVVMVVIFGLASICALGCVMIAASVSGLETFARSTKRLLPVEWVVLASVVFVIFALGTIVGAGLMQMAAVLLGILLAAVAWWGRNNA